MSFDLYLASASPRRKELLESMGLRVHCCPADIDESPKKNELPEDYVLRLALEKSKTSLHSLDKPIDKTPCLGADTIVVCSGELFGKPQNKDDAMRMWRAMSGGKHQVLTAIAFVSLSNHVLEQHTALSVSHVAFKSLSDDEMEAYWQSGEPQDKAGAYGIQGRASAWVESIEGSYSGIMGLPLFETNQVLKTYGLAWL